MLDIDTFRIAIPSEQIRDFDKSKYSLTVGIDSFTGQIDQEFYKLKKNARGLAFVSSKNKSVIVHGSSKILGYDCRELLNKNNFEKVLQIISEKAFLNYNCREVMAKGSFCIVHATKHIPVEQESDVDGYIDTLSFLDNNRFYRHQKYINQTRLDGYKGNGAQFIRTVQTKQRKERLIFYNKLAEISCNDPMAYKYLSDNGLINSVAKDIRVECNLNSHYKLKQRCDAKSAIINDVLNSKKDPVDAIFTDVVKYARLSEQRNGLSNISQMSKGKVKPKDIEWFLGSQQIIKACDGNEKMIKVYYENYGCSPSVISKKMTKLRPLIQEMKKTKFDTKKGQKTVLEKIRYIQEKIKMN